MTETEDRHYPQAAARVSAWLLVLPLTFINAMLLMALF